MCNKKKIIENTKQISCDFLIKNCQETVETLYLFQTETSSERLLSRLQTLTETLGSLSVSETAFVIALFARDWLASLSGQSCDTLDKAAYFSKLVLALVVLIVEPEPPSSEDLKLLFCSLLERVLFSLLRLRSEQTVSFLHNCVNLLQNWSAKDVLLLQVRLFVVGGLAEVSTDSLAAVLAEQRNELLRRDDEELLECSDGLFLLLYLHTTDTKLATDFVVVQEFFKSKSFLDFKDFLLLELLLATVFVSTVGTEKKLEQGLVRQLHRVGALLKNSVSGIKKSRRKSARVKLNVLLAEQSFFENAVVSNVAKESLVSVETVLFAHFQETVETVDADTLLLHLSLTAAALKHAQKVPTEYAELLRCRFLSTSVFWNSFSHTHSRKTGWLTETVVELFHSFAKTGWGNFAYLAASDVLFADRVGKREADLFVAVFLAFLRSAFLSDFLTHPQLLSDPVAVLFALVRTDDGNLFKVKIVSKCVWLFFVFCFQSVNTTSDLEEPYNIARLVAEKKNASPFNSDGSYLSRSTVLGFLKLLLPAVDLVLLVEKNFATKRTWWALYFAEMYFVKRKVLGSVGPPNQRVVRILCAAEKKLFAETGNCPLLDRSLVSKLLRYRLLGEFGKQVLVRKSVDNLFFRHEPHICAPSSDAQKRVLTDRTNTKQLLRRVVERLQFPSSKDAWLTFWNKRCLTRLLLQKQLNEFIRFNPELLIGTGTSSLLRIITSHKWAVRMLLSAAVLFARKEQVFLRCNLALVLLHSGSNNIELVCEALSFDRSDLNALLVTLSDFADAELLWRQKEEEQSVALLFARATAFVPSCGEERLLSVAVTATLATRSHTTQTVSGTDCSALFAKCLDELSVVRTVSTEVFFAFVLHKLVAFQTHELAAWQAKLHSPEFSKRRETVRKKKALVTKILAKGQTGLFVASDPDQKLEKQDKELFHQVEKEKKELAGEIAQLNKELLELDQKALQLCESLCRLLTLSVDTDPTAVFRLFNLWMEHEDRISALIAIIKRYTVGSGSTHKASAKSADVFFFGRKISLHKFVPVAKQLLGRLSTLSTDKAKGSLLYLLCLAVLSTHPFQTTEFLFPLAETSAVCAELLSDLCATRFGEKISLSHRLVLFYKELAEKSFGKSGTNTQTRNMPEALFEKSSQLLGAVIPTASVPLSPSGEYSERLLAPFSFARFDRKVSVSPQGITKPLILRCFALSGDVYKQLLKPNDDMRQDAAVQQTFVALNQLLSVGRLRVYKAVPLGKNIGVIGWVQHAVPLNGYITAAHKAYASGPLDLRALRKKMEKAPTPSKLQVFTKVCAVLEPKLRFFFCEHFPSPAAHVLALRKFATSCAVASVVSFVLGIGDRHTENILLDQLTGEVVHIDFGIMFEQGKRLRVPELVPFRLTPELVDALGLGSVEGVFKRHCEKTAALLQTHKEVVLSLLRIFMYDPVEKWVLNKHKLKEKLRLHKRPKVVSKFLSEKLEEIDADADWNINAEQMLECVRSKLQGCVGHEQYGVKGQVNKLILDATNPELLSSMFPGWAPWF